MQKSAQNRKGSGTIARVLGLSFSSALIFTIVVAIRHILETPMRLESPLPGESHYYKWKRGYIFYKVLGKPEAPPLLLLHSPGLVASAYEMRNMIEPLAQHYRVYAPDLLGFGISDRPSIDYSADIYVALCRDFLTDIVKHQATIVASRISCNYAVATAATSPNLCERLVLISPVALKGRQEHAPSLPSGDIKIAFVRVWRSLLQAVPVKWLVYPMLSTRFALRSSQVKQQSLISDVDLDYFYEEGKAAIASQENTTIEAYCTKCKMKRKMLNATEVTSKDGRMAIRGTCEVCGSNLHRFGRLKQQTSA